MMTPRSLSTALAVAALLACTAATAQTRTVADTNALRDADAMQKAFLARDWETFARYVYPSFITSMGGKEMMIETVKDGLENFEKGGVKMVSFTPELPLGIIRHKKELQAVIPVTLVMTIPPSTYRRQTYMLALSNDNGAHWSFINTSGIDREMLKSIVPSLDRKLKIPRDGEMIVVEEIQDAR